MMDAKHTAQHISQEFERELDDICNKVAMMGGLVEQQIEFAINAFSNSDLNLAERVIKRDDQVNALESAIDQECVQIIALRQPAAIDLRELIAVIKIVTELERIGDQAKRVAQMTIHLAINSEHLDSYYELHHIAEMVKVMLRQVLDAFARKDTTKLEEMPDQDESVTREYKSVVRQLVTQMMEDPRNVRRSLDVLWVAKALERIGDHACNIGEYVIYMLKGEDVRHVGSAGLCHSCKHFLEIDDHYHCQLKNSALTQAQTEKVCLEHSGWFHR